MTTWLPVEGYGDRYEVSDQGQVRRTRDGYVLSEEPIVGGYRRVSLSHLGKHKKALVHVLVARAFIGPRPDGHEVDHEDGRAHNNVASNLRYLTPAQNVQASFALGRRKPPSCGQRHAQSKFTDEIVMAIRCMHREGATQSSLAVMFGVYQSTIERIVNYKTWRHIP